MSNSGNQPQQQGFYGNTGFNTSSNGAGGPPPQQQGAQQHQNQNNGATPPTTTTSANTGGSGSAPAYGGPPSNLNTNVPTPGGNGTQSAPPTTSSTGGTSGSNTNTSARALVPATATTTVAATSADGSTSAIQTQASSSSATMNPQQQQQAKELNAASLCRYGQETVQEIVSRTQELYQTLRGAQPPDGKTPTQAMDRKPKFQETLRNIRGLYKRLRVIYDKIEESFPASADLPLEERIPYSDQDWEREPMNEKRDTEAYRQALEEYEEVKEMVIFKNRHMRETLDLMRNIIWDINTMLAMRKE